MNSPSLEFDDDKHQSRPRRLASAHEFMRSIPLDKPRAGPSLVVRESQSMLPERLASVLDPTSVYAEVPDQDIPVLAPVISAKKRPLFASCPSQGTGQTRNQWQRSMAPHLLGSRVYIARYSGSPFMVISMLRHSLHDRDRRASTDVQEQVVVQDLDRLIPEPGQSGVSYRRLLESPADQILSLYNPRLLDDPDKKFGSNRLVMNLPCFLSSVIAFVRFKDLRLDMNRQFSMKHPWLHPSMSLSKIRSIKSKMLGVVRELDMEISTAAIACAYFEMLLIKGVIKKEIRNVLASVCLLLASKFNAGASEQAELLDMACDVFRVKRQNVLDLELYGFVQLEFNLHLTPAQVLPHFAYLLQLIDSDIIEYLGRNCYEQFCQSLGLEAV